MTTRLLGKTLLLPLIALALSGCASALTSGSSDYGCPGYPDGVKCKSAGEVYQMTDPDVSFVRGMNKSSDNTMVNGKEEKSAPTRPVGPHELAIKQLTVEDPIPVRTPSRVMRIWIAPWEDAKGNLHMTNYVFTEVEQRKWLVGEPYTVGASNLHPLDVRRRVVADAPPVPGIDIKKAATDTAYGILGDLKSMMPAKDRQEKE